MKVCVYPICVLCSWGRYLRVDRPDHVTVLVLIFGEISTKRLNKCIFPAIMGFFFSISFKKDANTFILINRNDLFFCMSSHSSSQFQVPGNVHVEKEILIYLSSLDSLYCK